MSEEEIEKLPTSVFEFIDNSEELIAAGMDWDHPLFPGLYKITLQPCQSPELPPLCVNFKTLAYSLSQITLCYVMIG